MITEVRWNMRGDENVQNEFYGDLEKGIYKIAALTAKDFKRVAELNSTYKNRKPDLADLSLIVVSENLGIDSVLTVDEKDFEIYRRFKNKPFKKVTIPRD